MSAQSAVGMARVIAARWAATGAPAPALNTPIEWRTIDYTATVFNPGTPGGFTAFITTRRTILATPASAATIDASNGAPARFATCADTCANSADDETLVSVDLDAGAILTIADRLLRTSPSTRTSRPEQ